MRTSPNWLEIIGGRLRAARKAKGLDQRALADELDLSVAFISDIERGHRSIAAERRKAFADAVGLPVDMLTELDHATMVVVANRLAAKGWARASQFVREMAGGGA
jgi:transcriptional regulator with XRE-family HTH domain